MCKDCWREKYGAPTITTDRTYKAATMIANVYLFHPTGGYGHIVFDDWNLNDGSIDSCLGDAERNKWGFPEDESREQHEALSYFRDLTLEERASALGIVDGFVESDWKSPTARDLPTLDTFCDHCGTKQEWRITFPEEDGGGEITGRLNAICPECDPDKLDEGYPVDVLDGSNPE